MITVEKNSAPDTKSDSTKLSDQAKDRMLAQLIDMGFPHDDAFEALCSTEYDLNTACTVLAQQSSDNSAATGTATDSSKKYKG